MLRLLVDTSTWLDLARRRDGQKVIVPIRVLVHWGKITLLAPQLLLDEYERNRGRLEAAMSSGVAERFRLLRRDIVEYGGDDHQDTLTFIDGLAHQVPLIGAMTTRNFREIVELLEKGHRLEPGPDEHAAVVQRGLQKLAPLHRQRNSVADALLIELYAAALRAGDPATGRFAFVTSNHEDFSASGGDRRQPHPDIAGLFEQDGSSYHLGVEGLVELLRSQFADEFEELEWESDISEEPRRLDEILAAEQEYFNLISFGRHLVFHMREMEERNGEPLADEAFQAALEAEVARRQAKNPDLRLNEDMFEWGMWNGKLSALRWVLGSEWDFLDT